MARDDSMVLVLLLSFRTRAIDNITNKFPVSPARDINTSSIVRYLEYKATQVYINNLKDLLRVQRKFSEEHNPFYSYMVPFESLYHYVLCDEDFS